MIKPELNNVYRVLVVSGFAALVILTTALANRNVYSKDSVDNKVQAVQEMHNRDTVDTQRQLNRIEGNVDKLVDKLIEGG